MLVLTGRTRISCPLCTVLTAAKLGNMKEETAYPVLLILLALSSEPARVST